MNRGVNYTKKFIDLLWENTLNYNTSIRSKHNISAVIGFTAQKTNINESQITGLNLPSDDIQTLNQASSIDLSGTYTQKTPIGLLSYLGRVTYDYEGKYLCCSPVYVPMAAVIFRRDKNTAGSRQYRPAGASAANRLWKMFTG